MCLGIRASYDREGHLVPAEVGHREQPYLLTRASFLVFAVFHLTNAIVSFSSFYFVPLSSLITKNFSFAHGWNQGVLRSIIRFGERSRNCF